jgi:hypothetical protein
MGLIAILATGCRPDEAIWWSPDGRVAAVRTSEGLRFTDAEGHLSGVVLEGEVQSADWMPDSSALVVSRSYKVSDWAAAEKLLPTAEAQAARELARSLPDLLKAALAGTRGSLDHIEDEFFKPLGLTVVGDQLEPMFRISMALYRDEIMKAVSGLPNTKELERELTGETNGISIHEISLLTIQDGKVAGGPRAVVRSLRALLNPLISPKHSLFAFRTSDGALKVTALDGTNTFVVSDENTQSAVWTSDGQRLVHVVMPSSDKLGEIRSRTVATANGELLKGDAAPGPETLAMAAFDLSGGARLRRLPDGRILFASMPVTLPAGVDGIYTQMRFFMLDLTRTNAALSPISVTEGSLPADLSAFSVSPNGQRIAVVEAETDAVAVLELATGKVEVISPSRQKKSRLIPAWRNNQELTFAALGSDPSRPELYSWKAGNKPQVISKEWPADVLKEWLAD